MELIEKLNEDRVEVAPYWNVNKLAYYNYIIIGCVEVAPYWNVNYRTRKTMRIVIQ